MQRSEGRAGGGGGEGRWGKHNDIEEGAAVGRTPGPTPRSVNHFLPAKIGLLWLDRDPLYFKVPD